MRLMLTGGAGYLGTHVLVDLLDAGHEAVVLDDLSTGHYEAVRRAQAITGRSCAFVLADIADTARVLDALHGVDAVIHFAASKLCGESMERPEAYFRNNVAGMCALLDAMEAAGVRRLVYSSSAAVYGAQPRMPIAEDAPLRPESPYGASKAQGEQMLDWMARCRGWSAVSLRYFNPVGAHPSGLVGEPIENAGSLVPRALKALARPTERLTVYGTDYDTPDGTCLRDYVHVTDLARAHLLALGVLDRPGHAVYNVGTGRPYSVREVLVSCARVVGREVPHVEGARRPGDPPCVVADPRRFRERTGFSATLGLDEMVASAWRWWTSNPSGYVEAAAPREDAAAKGAAQAAFG